MLRLFLLLSIMSIALSCCEKGSMDSRKEQLLTIDRDFSKLSAEKGMAHAFDYYMNDSATMLRNGSKPIVGRENINSLFDDTPPNDTLIWEPDFAEISNSGDLGYTIGHWEYISKDSTGKKQSSFGNYVTIWKKQPDGSWKYTFDTGTTMPKSNKTE